MLENYKKNDPRMWLFNTVIGKWLVRLFVVVIIISVVLKWAGVIE